VELPRHGERLENAKNFRGQVDVRQYGGLVSCGPANFALLAQWVWINVVAAFFLNAVVQVFSIAMLSLAVRSFADGER
jgi:hypothetical protein